MGGRNQVACAVYTDAVKIAGDDGTLAAIQADDGHLWTGDDLPAGGAAGRAIDHVPKSDNSIARRSPVEAQAGVVTFIAGVDDWFQRGTDQLLWGTAIRTKHVIGAGRGAGTDMRGSGECQ